MAAEVCHGVPARFLLFPWHFIWQRAPELSWQRGELGHSIGGSDGTHSNSHQRGMDLFLLTSVAKSEVEGSFRGAREGQQT